MQTQNHRHALNCLAAADLASDLADKIQSLHSANIAAAHRQTINQGAVILKDALAKLPPPFNADLSDSDLADLVGEFLS